MNTIVGTTRVWLTDSNTSLKDLHSLPPDRAVGKVMYYGADMASAGWVEIGTALITITFADTEEVTRKQVKYLKQEVQNVRADAQMRITNLEQRIQELLALPNLENDDAQV